MVSLGIPWCWLALALLSVTCSQHKLKRCRGLGLSPRSRATAKGRKGRAMASNTKGIALGAVFAGGLLAWSGLKGKKWTAGLKDIIAGKAPTNAPDTPINDLSSYAGEIQSATGNTGANSQSAAHNQAIAQVLAAPFGWSAGQEWQDLLSLWNKESGWSNTAENPTSGAYGVAQALPSTKYPLPGRPPSEGGSSDPTTQIAWGLAYILGRYGSPSSAWAHEVANDWY